MVVPIDSEPLRATPSRSAIAGFRAGAAGRDDVVRATKADQDVITVLVAVVAVVVVVWIALTTDLLDSIAGTPLAPVPRILILAAGGVVVIGAVIAWLAVARRANWRRWTRLDAFARANGLVFSPSGGSPAYPGAVFGVGDSREVLEHLTSAEPPLVDYGNTRYAIGSGKNRRTKTWGFLALQLHRALPHMVLDSTANNGFLGTTGLPTGFRRDQVLELEGDFNRHFTLYCPREYERDALYVFTPDLMALLIDHAAPFDVEIVDRWLFVYSPTRFDLLDPGVHERLRRIVDTVGAKTLSRTDRYVDERVEQPGGRSIGDVAPDVVAPSGRRLRRRVPVVAVVVGVVLAALWVGWQLLDLAATLGG